MSVIQAFILGAVQGLAEFLPISSSGHLMLAEKLMGISAESGDLLLLNVLLHVGTLVAVMVVYWKRIWNMLMHPIRSELKLLVLATIPAVAAALLVDFDDAFEGRFIIWSFYLTSIVLLAGSWLHKYNRKHKRLHKPVKAKDAIGMGLMQAVAILPGLSRSGSTLSGGLATGLSRKRAADFAFLMSIPAILGSLVLELKDVIFNDAAAGASVEILPILVGVLTAAAFGLLAIKGFLAMMRKVNANIFAIYTFLLGSFLLLNKYVFYWVELF